MKRGRRDSGSNSGSGDDDKQEPSSKRIAVASVVTGRPKARAPRKVEKREVRGRAAPRAHRVLHSSLTANTDTSTNTNRGGGGGGGGVGSKARKLRSLGLAEKKRGKGLLGVLMGTLDSAQSEVEAAKETLRKREEVFSKIDAELAAERAEGFERSKEEKAAMRAVAQEDKLKALTAKVTSDLESRMVRCQESRKPLSGFMSTTTEPMLFYMPKKEKSGDTERVLDSAARVEAANARVRADAEALLESRLSGLKERYGGGGGGRGGRGGVGGDGDLGEKGDKDGEGSDDDDGADSNDEFVESDTEAKEKKGVSVSDSPTPTPTTTTTTTAVAADNTDTSADPPAKED